MKIEENMEKTPFIVKTPLRVQAQVPEFLASSSNTSVLHLQANTPAKFSSFQNLSPETIFVSPKR
jgi:hypothetical protein